MAQRPQVHGPVPRAPEGGDVVGVPPVAVEVAVREVQQLAHQVQERVERQVEETQPYQMVWNLEILRFLKKLYKKLLLI